MRKKKVEKKQNEIKDENIITKEDEKDVVQSIGSYHDFLIFEKKDIIKEPVLEFQNVESENNFLKDFLILQRKPNQEKSRFTELFKEITEKENNKLEKIEEPKSENLLIPISNPHIENNRFPSFDLNQNIFTMNNFTQNKINFGENENKFIPNNNMISISDPNSRTQSDFGFRGHGGSVSSKSTNTNTYYIRNSLVSNESNISNIINFHGGGNMHLIYKNNNIIKNNNTMNNININQNFNFNNNINNYIETEFEPNVDIRKVLALEDTRSTMMIKNIPNKFTREKLLELINKNFAGTYDLLILPKDGNKNRNFGYAFINFISCYSIPYFYFMFNGKKWVDTNSKKVCEITYSKIQGRNELISHYPNKIIFFNDVINLQNGNKFFIPKDYLILFKQLFPNHPIEENNFGFITKIPFIF